MKKILESLPGQIQEAVAIGRAFEAPDWRKKISKIIFCGMGGSAIGGDILRTLVNSYSPTVFEVCRTGKIPGWTDSSTLVIFSSYSGNTPETLGNLDVARKAKAKILILSSGGKLGQAAVKHKLPYLQVPGGLPPRCAIGYLTFSLLPVLAAWGRLKFSEKEFHEALRVVAGVSLKRAKLLAKQLWNRSVHFYGYSNFSESVLTRWRAQFAENSKVLASSHLIPEMLHNEVESWKFPAEIIQKSSAVFFSDASDPAWLKNKIRAAQAMMRQAGADVIEIKSSGTSLAARLFSLLALADWVSFELAALNEIDPIIIPVIESLKKVK